MPIRDLKAQIARLPEQPGVYIFENGAGDTLYVGKARVLRDRVRSYLGAHGMSPRIDALLDEAQRLEFIVTDSVMEALALENHLIKNRAPRYNILLRDDKNYPYLQLTTGEPFPRVLVARRVQKDEHYYAGPFLPALLGRRTMGLTHRLFGIRSCNEVITGERGRPCLEYDIKRCIAPCVRELCSPEAYREAVEHTKLFLEGRNDELMVTLRERMTEAAEAERFEQAAQLRDALKTIEAFGTRQQKMSSAELGDRDAFGLKVGPAGASVQVFQVRHGRVVERIELVTDAEALDATAARDTEVLQAAVQQFYEDRVPPLEVHIPIALAEPETATLEEWLSARAERRVRLFVPKRGEKRGLLELAARNAEVAYQQRFNENTAAHYDALETLRVVLNLPAVPRRIECFDISTIQGTDTVASMVVCEDGRMRKGEYRKFRIRGPGFGTRGSASLGSTSVAVPPGGELIPDEGLAAPAAVASESSSRAATAIGGGVPIALNNDFAAMREVVLRRYRRVLEAGGPFPDLILIDGGKGQLTAAYDALEELGLGRLIAVGIAKKEELLFTRDREDAIALPHESPALLLITRIRDEAHRFAVTFHRERRAKRSLRSDLDVITSIGPRRRKALLTAFGSLAGVRRATREELVRVVGTKSADAVLAHFAAQR
ncbi:MAG TPA: excinuclease ABC subunit UvrC [Vicinamibacterales bacterium]|nr:excinuclease ABC subunit UvrC [Vicinamibacterales bacterium]